MLFSCTCHQHCKRTMNIFICRVLLRFVMPQSRSESVQSVGVDHSSIKTLKAMHRAYMMYEAHANARLLDRRVYRIILFDGINSCGRLHVRGCKLDS
jgi:hypothetical protein